MTLADTGRADQDWVRLAPALIQRAELLDRLLADLYGPREVLRRGLVPAEVIRTHPGFLRECDRIRLPGPHQLLLTGTDLVLGADGWVAAADSMQVPAEVGGGSAWLRSALESMAPITGRPPRVVILDSAETDSDPVFPVLQGKDLMVRDGIVRQRSTDWSEPVDVVLLRIDGRSCDPLELRPDSQLGVPGLLHAARLGNVSIVNPPGAGILENPALAAFLPAVCEALLGAPLQLPSAPTWWCGDRVSRRYVLASLSGLLIRSISGREAGVNGAELSTLELDGLTARIEAEPGAWYARALPEPEATPALRSFAVAAGNSFQPFQFVAR
jgi:uncharacterized circularly permuted ATP-grasp superfamily protein